MIIYANDTIFEDTCTGCKEDCSACPLVNEPEEREDVFEELAEILRPEPITPSI